MKAFLPSLIAALAIFVLFLFVDPDFWRYNSEMVIRGHGYPLERYSVRAEDGYFFTLYRIPPRVPAASNETKRLPILFVHGF